MSSIWEMNKKNVKKYGTKDNTYDMFPIGTRVKVICVEEDFEFFDGNEIGIVIENKNDYLTIKVKFDNGRRDWGFEPHDLFRLPQQEQDMVLDDRFAQKFPAGLKVSFKNVYDPEHGPREEWDATYDVLSFIKEEIQRERDFILKAVEDSAMKPLIGKPSVINIETLKFILSQPHQ